MDTIKILQQKIKNVYQEHKDKFDDSMTYDLIGRVIAFSIKKEESSDIVNEFQKLLTGYEPYYKIYIIAQGEKGSEVLLEPISPCEKNLDFIEFFKTKVKSFIDYGGDIDKGEYILNFLFANSFDKHRFYYNDEYDTPLKFAIIHNDMETAKLLLNNGADINKEIKGWCYKYDCSSTTNFIKEVCAFGSNEFIKFIIDEYMKKNSISKVSKIPGIEYGLVYLYNNQNFEMIHSLFEYDCIYELLNDSNLLDILDNIMDLDPDFNSEKRCMIKLEDKMIKIVEFFMSYGININKKYVYEETILFNAIIGKVPRFTMFLFENGLTMDDKNYNNKVYSPNDIKFYNICYTKYMFEKCKERSDLLREGLIQKYHSPENIEQWSVYLNKPFDEVIEIM